MWVIYDSALFRMFMPKQFVAITLAEWIITGEKAGELSPEIIYHDQRHVWQWRWHLYVLFPPMYFLIMLFVFLATGHGYRDHPYERDARSYAEQKLADEVFGE